jgi:hypothetical protein
MSDICQLLGTGGGYATPPMGFAYASHHHSEFSHLKMKTVSHFLDRDD